MRILKGLLTEDKNEYGLLDRVPEQIVVCAENVWFRYPGAAADVLRGLNFSMLPGQRVLLLGAEGAGKSTFIRLLSGLLTPDRGTITINGIPVQSYSESARARMFAQRAGEKGDSALVILDDADRRDDQRSCIPGEKLLRTVGERALLCCAVRPVIPQSMDLIYVLEGGRIVEAGSHGSLLNRQGRYFKMWQQQTTG